VNASASVSREAAQLSPLVEKRFERKNDLIREIIREARPHQWLKNTLVFMAPVAGHALLDPGVFISTFISFVAFCVAASGIYFINDLLDLESDRKTPRKRSRPFASGALPIRYGLLGPFLVVASMLIGLSDSLEVALVVYVYIAASLFYSQYLKTRPLADVFCLAILYTIRLFAGGIASAPACLYGC
jgi:4-hydroxybenzoate polyprenyltransferase